MKKTKKSKCVWKYQDMDDFCETSCGNAHTFIEGNIKENKYKFCPYCGKRIKEKP